MFELLVMGGDGVGPEVTSAALTVLRAVNERVPLDISIRELLVGDGAVERWGTPFPDESRHACDALSKSGKGAILFGAVAEEPIGILRHDYELFANIRPIRVSEELLDASSLKPERAKGVDMLIVRELVGDLYWGERRTGVGEEGRWAIHEMIYTERQVRRIVRVGLEYASNRRKHLTFVHKGNVLIDMFALWKDCLDEEAKAFPSVVVDDILVDNMALQLLRRPRDFDVLLCSNMFGDILSDLAGGIVGSIGMLPSASMSLSGFALYEPIGGTAPDIAGRNIANPLASILSVALMCRYSLRNEAAAALIEDAAHEVLREFRTSDMAAPGREILTTTAMAEKIAATVMARRPRGGG